MRLVLEARALNGRWSISDVWQRDQIAWPPSPDTLFSALTAAAASANWGESSPVDDVLMTRYGRVLTWLEQLPAPEIAAPDQVGAVEGHVWFVPVGDDVGLDQARSRKARYHNSVGTDEPVSWGWQVEAEEAEEQRRWLEEIANRVTRIGSSRGPTLVTVKLLADEAWQPSLIPAEHGRIGLRGVYPGRLADLEAWYQAGERPRPGMLVAYALPSEKPLESPWSQFIVLRKATGLALGLDRSIDVTEAVRNALLAHLGDEAPEILSGHAAGQASSQRDHLAIVPMARVADSYADGLIHGIGLILPRGTDDATWHRLVMALGRWMQGGGKLIIGGRTQWTLEFPTDEHRKTLEPRRYQKAAQVWTSVTPVVFDRYPRMDASRSAEAVYRSLHGVVSDMCRKAGLPAPLDVRVSPSTGLHGAVSARAHGLGTRSYLAQRYIAHLEIRWADNVPGPVLLGAGRYFGLGLMLPAPGASAVPATAAAPAAAMAA
jgi:CRISPR-associated protein Csb2